MLLLRAVDCLGVDVASFCTEGVCAESAVSWEKLRTADIESQIKCHIKNY